VGPESPLEVVVITELRRFRLRTYADEADRGAHRPGFCGGEWWAQQQAFAMDHVVVFLEATMHRDCGELDSVPWPLAGERAGSRPDGSPEGWTASTRRTFVRETCNPAPGGYR
jgi:hypothetical protein